MNSRELADRLITIRADYDRAKEEVKAKGDAAVKHYNAYRATLGIQPLSELDEKRVVREKLENEVERAAQTKLRDAMEAWWPGRWPLPMD